VTVPTACVFGKRVTVAWEDFRDGAARIYHAQSPDGGNSWTTGASGTALLTDPIAANVHHFMPQIITDPTGVIGCSFYEFGPKPAKLLIDVMMAESYDGGASFTYFTVTDQAWDPTIDAPFADGIPTVAFIGDYFGIDASNAGFYPLWTDTRTGIQELWTAIVPERRCAFIVERSTLGQDEIDARRTQPGGPVVPDTFRVVVDGFSGPQLGVTGSGSTLNVASPVAGMNIICTGNTADTGSYGPQVQRFTFHYNVDFGPTDAAFSFAGQSKIVTVHASVLGVAASADLELVKQADPFILHGDPAWLSVDLRVFKMRAGESKFGATMGSDGSTAPNFIQTAIQKLTAGHGRVGAETFDGTLTTNEDASSLSAFPQDNNGVNVFNFAIAKVHYIGLAGATNVRVFFRLFQAQSTNAAFDSSTTYRRAATNPHGQPIALAGIRGGEYVTLPFFATPRVNSLAESMANQTDDPNVQTLPPNGGKESFAFFGCWLDINQPFQNVIPITVWPFAPDGPFDFFGISTALPIQQAILRNPHQCLVAEIAFDPVPIPFGKDPGNWDKLAQRNLAWSDLGSARALDTFEIRATQAPPSPSLPPDELMIDWGRVPKGTVASIFLPGAQADEILDLASRMYTNRRLHRADDHTLHCKAEGITYVPVPYGSNINYAGLLSLDVPSGVRPGQSFGVVVRQITNAFGAISNPSRPRLQPSLEAVTGVRSSAQWRRVFGAFQLNIPVHADHASLLLNEERLYAVMQWIAGAIPADNRWYSVFERYLKEIAGRITVFGGDPGKVAPSPTGTVGHGHTGGHDKGSGFTGKIAGLVFDHFGDFDGFILETAHGDHQFHSREKEIAVLVERAWRERLRVTIHTATKDENRPLSVVIHRPPVES
jgi:hypothetical protein